MVRAVIWLLILSIFIFFIIKKDWPKAIALFHILLFLFIIRAVNHYLGPLKCADGWRSYSIGTRGACSWHGGVEDRSGWFLICFIICFISYMYCYYVYDTKRIKKEEVENKIKLHNKNLLNFFNYAICYKIPIKITSYDNINDLKETEIFPISIIGNGNLEYINFVTKNIQYINFLSIDKYEYALDKKLTEVTILFFDILNNLKKQGKSTKNILLHSIKMRTILAQNDTNNQVPPHEQLLGVVFEAILHDKTDLARIEEIFGTKIRNEINEIYNHGRVTKKIFFASSTIRHIYEALLYIKLVNHEPIDYKIDFIKNIHNKFLFEDKLLTKIQHELFRLRMEEIKSNPFM